MLKLIIEDDEGRKTVVPFARDEITIGRQEGNTIRLTERNVSRRHARLFRQNGHIVVEDLDSYNGIRLNGDKISGPSPVHEGDLIQIGDYDLAVQSDQPQVAAAGPSGVAIPGAPMPRTEATTMRLDGLTQPLSPVTDDPNQTLNEDDGPAMASPDDVQAAPAGESSEAGEAGEPAARAPQSTAVIRVDQVEGNRERQILDLDPSEAPRLVVMNTDFAGREFACIRTELKIGRTDDNDIAIDHRSLSRTHCKVVREDNGEWRVLDMQSANGLMVNGEQYAQSTLRSGDVLELGHVKMKFVGPGESFTLSASKDGVQVKTGSKLPIYAIAAALVVVLAGGGYLMMGKKKPRAADPVAVAQPVVEDPAPAPEPETPKPADPVAVKPADPDPVKPVEPDPVKPAVEPVAVKAPDPVPPLPAQPEKSQRELAEEALGQARQAISEGDLKTAKQKLNTAQVDGSLHPQAKALLAQIDQEKAYPAELDRAQALIKTGTDSSLQKAKLTLDQVAGTKLFQERHATLVEALQAATQQQLQANAAKAAARPPPVEPAPAAVPAVETGLAAETRKLYEEANTLSKDKASLGKAKVLLLKCIKLDAGNSDCHRVLGSVYAKMGDPKNGVKHYKKFLELDPDHQKAPQVRQMVEAYEKSN